MSDKGLTYEEIMDLYKNGGPLLRSWLHDHAHKIMKKPSPKELEKGTVPTEKGP